MTWDKESIYDEQIAPLMAQIIVVCKEHRIPLVAQFQYAGADEEKAPAYVSTILPFEEASADFKQLIQLIHQTIPRPMVLTETVVTAPDGSKRITIGRVR